MSEKKLLFTWLSRFVSKSQLLKPTISRTGLKSHSNVGCQPAKSQYIAVFTVTYTSVCVANPQ